MKREFYVYALRKPDGSPFYVGKGRGRRARMHEQFVRSGRAKNRAMVEIVEAILGAGERVAVDIVRRFSREDSAYAFEAKLIAEIGRAPRGPLVNLTDGGKGTKTHDITDESRAAMSRASLGKPKAPTHRKNIAEGLARSDAFKAYKKKPISAATVAKIVAKNTGRKRSAETRAKISTSNARRKLSPESRAKISASVSRHHQEQKRA